MLATTKKDAAPSDQVRSVPPVTSTPLDDSASPDRIVTVLAVSPHADDHLILRNIFSHSNWRIRNVRTLSEARALFSTERIPVVISERNLPDGDWKDLLNSLQTVPEAPLLIVSSRVADDRLWGEVLNLGGYDLLMKPFDQTEVVRVISLAWLNWKHKTERARGLAAASRPLLAIGA